MNNKHIVLTLLGVAALVGLCIVGVKRKEVSKENVFCTIGILQTATHPALDAVREGFIDEIKSSVGGKINFVINNGQGSISTIHAMAQQFHAKQNIQGVFAIATPAAQAMVSVEKEKPICIAAVSLTPATQVFLSEKNVCGVSDMIDVRAEVEAMKALLPKVEAVGILYSTAETNSVAMVEIMVKEIEKIGLASQLIGVTSEADIEPALMSALRKVDVIVTPTDNMVASTIALISALMNKAGKPLVVSDNMLVKYGALMARGVDYYESGRQAGKIALQVLVHGKQPHEFAIEKVKTKEIFVNKEVAHAFGVVIPDSMKGDVVLV